MAMRQNDGTDEGEDDDPRTFGLSVPAALAALGLFAALAATLPAGAQSYPNRPVKIIVPTPAGGPVDVMARLLANALPPLIGQNVIVENRAGAGNTLGSKAAAAADPDGYTLLVSAASGLIMSPMVYKNAGYDETSFAPIALVAETPQVLVAYPAAPFNDRRRARRLCQGRTPASSITRPAAPAPCPISPPNCSSSSPAPTSSTCPTRAAGRR